VSKKHWINPLSVWESIGNFLRKVEAIKMRYASIGNSLRKRRKTSEKSNMSVGNIRCERGEKFRQPCVVVLRHPSHASEKASAVVTVCFEYNSPLYQLK
jgi:hypothetical protein